VRGQRHAPAVLYSRKRPGTHCTGGWVSPRAGLDRCGKSRPIGIRSPDRPTRSQSHCDIKVYIKLFITQSRGSAVSIVTRLRPGQPESWFGSQHGQEFCTPPFRTSRPALGPHSLTHISYHELIPWS